MKTYKAAKAEADRRNKYRPLSDGRKWAVNEQNKLIVVFPLSK